MTILEFLRQFRLGGYAIFDFIVAFVFIYFLSPSLTKLFRKIRLDVPKYNWLFLVLPISVLVHILIGNMTPMTQNFLDTQGHYFLKTVIILLTVFGVRGIKVMKKNR